MINVLTVQKAVGIFSLMKFFPNSEEARAALMESLGQMCSTDEQVLWLARRVANLYPEWPGFNEIRAVLCSKHLPRDGVEVYSAVYVDGIPSEKQAFVPQITGPVMRALVGGAMSADPVLDRLVVDLAAGMQPELRTPEELGAEAKAAHPELASLDDKHVGLKLLAKQRREEKRVDRELQAMFHVEEERRA